MNATSIAVLDTNVVLDWLLFQNPCMTPWVAALTAGRVRWQASPAMRNELAHVLERGLASARGATPQPCLAAWDRWAEMVPALPAAPARRLHCTDPDDQMFIDLAQTQGARWLLTRDRALLRLARRARAQGIEVSTPERWACVDGVAGA